MTASLRRRLPDAAGPRVSIFFVYRTAGDDISPQTGRHCGAPSTVLVSRMNASEGGVPSDLHKDSFLKGLLVFSTLSDSGRHSIPQSYCGIAVRYSMGRTVVGYSTSIAILYFSTIDLLRGIQSIEVTVPIFDVHFNYSSQSISIYTLTR